MLFCPDGDNSGYTIDGKFVGYTAGVTEDTSIADIILEPCVEAGGKNFQRGRTFNRFTNGMIFVFF